MFTPQQRWIAAQSKELADSDFGEHDRETGEDHFAHAAGQICAACDRLIEPRQEARRRGETGWVHDVCPPRLTDRR
jgi:hypothetical protein